MEGRRLVWAEGGEAGTSQTKKTPSPCSVLCVPKLRLARSLPLGLPSPGTAHTKEHFSDDLSAGFSLHKVNF